MAGNDGIALQAAIAGLEEAELDVVRGRRVLPHGDGFEDLRDDEFLKLYRLTKPVVSDMVDLLTPYLVHPSRVPAIGLESKTDIGYIYWHGLPQPSVSRVVDDVKNALNHPNIFANHIKLPQDINELRNVRARLVE